MRIHVIADVVDSDGGFFTEQLEQLGGEIVLLDRDALPAYASIGDTDVILLLGSDKSAHEPKWADVVTAESVFVRAALRDGTPVMGICYGAQLMARALGGTSWRADVAELGVQRVDTVDPLLCPEGPWLQLHSDVFAPPPNARVLGTSWRGTQCFIDDSHGARAIAWQFHPEVTAATYERWINEGYYGDEGVDEKVLIAHAYEHEPRLRNAAHQLTDAALHYLGVTA